MGNKLFITVDTEMDADEHWKKPFPREFTSVTKGIPLRLRPIWDKYKINPIYFVSYEVLQDEACCKILRDEIVKGAYIGAHLHPEYVGEQGKNTDILEKYPCSGCSYEEEERKLRELTRMIEDKLEIKPVWYRAARFGADLDSMRIIKELGYLYDSSITPGIDWSRQEGPDHRRGPKDTYDISENDYYLPGNCSDKLGITEYPVTIRGKRWGFLGQLLPECWLFYRWLRPTHMTLWEEKALIRDCASEKQDMVMMFHSMEVMIHKSPYVRNGLMLRAYLRRLDKTIEFALKKGYASY